MRIAILSRNKNLHSIRRLLQEAKRVGIECHVLDPLECQLVVDGKQSKILVGPHEAPSYDAVLPRIGASITSYGLAVVKHFEILGTYVVNSAKAIAGSRNKMTALQLLTEAGVKVPASVLSRTPRGLKAAVMAVKGMPVVMKVLEGTQGVGVMIVHTPVSLHSVLDTLRGLGQDVMMQEFLAKGAGRDYRAFVIGNRVIAAMARTAPAGEFRSNLHRGGQGDLVKLPVSYQRAAIAAAHKMGLEIAGVDMMEGPKGPLILEVNSSPGFEGIEKATGLNVAAQMIAHIAKEARKRARKKGKQKRRTTKKKR